MAYFLLVLIGGIGVGWLSCKRAWNRFIISMVYGLSANIGSYVATDSINKDGNIELLFGLPFFAFAMFSVLATHSVLEFRKGS